MDQRAPWVVFVLCTGAFVCRSCRTARSIHNAFTAEPSRDRCVSTYAALCTAALLTQGLALVVFFSGLRRGDPWPGLLLFVLVTAVSGFAINSLRPPEDDEQEWLSTRHGGTERTVFR